MERCHDNFFELLTEQRIQKLNYSEQHGMGDYLPVSIEPLRATPTTPPRKRVSKTSSDSRLNCPRALSPAMPVTADSPHIPQPYLIPSTSKMNPPSGLFTSIQQFIHNSQKSKNAEPKYNRSQPVHPDSESVFRTHTRKPYKH